MTDQQIGPYTIQQALGSGGMADVYLAWDNANRWPVALKVMRGTPGNDARMLKRFEREAALLMKLRHPHIIQVYAAGQTADNRTFIAMEYVAGGDLHDLMHQKRGNKLPVTEAAYLMRRVAGAMAYAHEQGIVHRDLKPSNILLRADNGEPVVADLGIAAIAGGANSLTGTMESLGTPHYMAPEQATSGVTVDGRADVYAIGVMLFELLTGRQPIEADNGWALLFRKQQEAAPPVLTFRHDLDPRLAAVVDACLQRDPAARYQTAGALAAALDAFLPADAHPPAPVKSRRATPTPRTPSGPPTFHPPAPARRMSPLLWVGGAVALLALLGVFVWPWLSGGGRATATPVASGSVQVAENVGGANPSPEGGMAIPSATMVIAQATSTANPTPAPATETAAPATETAAPATETAAPATVTPTPRPTDTPEPPPTRTADPVETPGDSASPATAGTTPVATTTQTVTPGAATASSFPVTLLGFEAFGSWRTGDQANGKLIQSSEQAHGGAFSARLDYNFPGPTNDFVVFTQERTIEGAPNALRLWVYGDGSGHYLNIWIRDDEGERWSVPLGQVGHTGWKQMTGRIDPDQGWPWGRIDGPDNGQVDFPIAFNAIVLDDSADNIVGQGTIYLDDLSADVLD